MSIQNLVLGMRYPNISQGCNAYIPSKDYYSTSDSHRNYNAIDIKGMDTGKDAWRAKNRYKCIAIYDFENTGFYNTVFFTPCDEKGNPVKVMTPSHGLQYVTIKMTHDEKIRVRLNEVYDSDYIIYMEGSKGLKQPANHIHLEACIGITTAITKVTGSKYYNGLQYILKDGLPLNELFFLLKGYTMFEPSDSKRYPWKWVDSVEYTGDIMEYTKDESKGVYGVDLSAYDKDSINFEELSKKAKFAILKVGYGKDLDGQHDECFLDFCKECDKYGIKKGAYIYSYAETEQEAKNEAAHIIRLCNEAGGDFPIGLFLDIEDKLQTKLSAAENTRNVLAYIREIWNTDYKAGVYSYSSFFDSYLYADQIQGNAIIWVANYGLNDGNYSDITTNFDYDIRQYTSKNADKSFSSRDSLDQNLHFGYSNYVVEEQTSDSLYKNILKQLDEMSEKISKITALEKSIAELNSKIEDLNQKNLDLSNDVDELEERVTSAGNVLLGG